MEIGKIRFNINDSVVEKIAQANEMSEKLKEALAFFEENMQELAEIKKMLRSVQDAVGKKLLLLPIELELKHEIDTLLSNFGWFSTYDKDLKRFINSVQANSLRKNEAETRRRLNDDFM